LGSDGQILLDKPAGMTSFSALKGFKSSLGTRRIGHTGTLDKFATGLLVVLIGRYTRLAELFSGLDKCYRATFVLGRTTETLDPEGEVVGEGPVPGSAERYDRSDSACLFGGARGGQTGLSHSPSRE
jgi:tRNA pseudouridine55 synthase